MLVFPNEKLVLFAVPKTGTTALHAALAPRAGIVLRDPPGLKHAPVRRYRRFIAPLLAAAGSEEFETVAVVRHPTDWLGSWFRYRQRPALDGQRNSTAGMSFDAFADGWCQAEPPPPSQVGSQATFVGFRDGAAAVDHLFRYEEQDDFLRFLEGRLGALPKLERRNVSPAMDLSLSDPVAARVREVRAADFATWEAAGST